MEVQAIPVRVLLIEDDEDDLHLIRDLLSNVSDRQYTLAWEAEYDAAIEALLAGPFDVCLLDYRLGPRNGLDLLKEAVSRGCMIPVILLSGFGDYALDLESMQAGAADYIGKDEISAKALERSIRHSIERIHVNLELEQRVRKRTEELVKANEALSASETFTRSSLNALSAKIAILDEAGFILCTNLSWENFGKENGLAGGYDFPGIDYLAICDSAQGAGAEQASEAAAGIREVLSGQRELFELEYPCHCRSERRWFNMRVTRFKDYSPARVVVAHEDITAGKLAEEALAIQNARMRAVLDSMPAGVAMYEGEPLKPVLVNPKGEELLGRSLPASMDPEDLAPYFQAYIAGTNELYPARSMPVVRAMSGESAYIDDMEILKSDGSRTRLEISGAPVLDSSGAIMGAVAIFGDITERKWVESALKQSEENFRQRTEELETLMELAPVPIFMAHDRECRFITCNRAAGSLVQAVEGENISAFSFAGTTARQRFFRNGRPLAVDELPMPYAFTHGEEVKDEEIDVLLPQGERLTVLGSATPLWDSHGNIRGCMGAFMDITQLKQAEEEARAQKEILEKAFQSSPYLMMLVDRNGRILKANRTSATLSDKSKEGTLDIVGSAVLGCLESFDELKCWEEPQCSCCPVLNRIAHAFETGESVYNAEESMTVRRGSLDVTADMLISTALVKYRASDAVLVTVMDITQRRRAEEALRQSEQKFTIAFANNPAAISITRFEDGVFREVNDRWVKLSGYSRQEALGNSARRMHLWPSSAALSRYVRELKETGCVQGWEQEFVKKSGEACVVEFSSQTLTVHGEKLILSTSVDITERKRAEETLRKSEERFRELAENIRDVFWVTTPKELIYVSPAYEEICGMNRDRLHKDRDSFKELVHPEDRERAGLAVIGGFGAKLPLRKEYRIIRGDGVRRWIRARSFPVLEQGRVVRTVGIAEDVTSIKEAEELVRIQRDLAFRLGSAGDLNEAMEYLLEACLEFDHLDCGSIQLLEKETGMLKMVLHRGLSDSLAQSISLFGPTSAKTQFVMRGEPGYWSRPGDIFDMRDLLVREGIMALAVIPVKSKGEVLAVLNFASRSEPEIPQNVRIALEVIAVHIGELLSRVKLMDTIRAQSERLQETNSALKALLKRREEDRKELEESLLNNVKHLVLPYVAKLKKSRLAVDQRQFLEILESHLVEITSPFVQKISAPMLGLTPTEIRVADLIRQGKSSKEIAELLGISEWAVVFHRRGIRRKLGLAGKKLNLQTYLSTLQ